MLKEVRRRVAEANNIPLRERECTHTGDCAGTCPYCESEVRYLEHELSKRRALGKAVAVAGIALSTVTMAGCATSEPVTSEPVTSNSTDEPCKTSGRPVTDALTTMGGVTVEDGGKPKAKNPEKNKSKKGKKSKKIETYQIRGIMPMTDTLPKIDTATMVTPSEPQNDEVLLGLIDDSRFDNRIAKEDMANQGSIPEFDPAVFTEGKFEDWLRSQLQKFQSYMQDPRLDPVEIRFFVEEGGYVSLINILNMPEVYKQEDEAFRAKVTAVISGSEWSPATVSGKPVSSLVTVRLRDLR